MSNNIDDMVPLPLRADAYTISSEFFASEAAKEYSCYNFTNRYSPTKNMRTALDSRMVFYGISESISKWLLRPVTRHDIEECLDFMSTADSISKSMRFPKDLWNRVVNECHGYLPLKIEGLIEGMTFFPNEPVFTVENTLPGFGELCAILEARFVGEISHSTAVATYCAHWYDSICEHVLSDLCLLTGKNPTPEEVANIASWSIHNFGDRACNSSFSAIMSGLAHLLFFNGTDNFCSAYVARKQGLEYPAGTSIFAHAHRTVLGHRDQKEAFRSIMRAIPDGGFAACVLDTTCYQQGVKDLLEIAKEFPTKTIVGRPDSGDCYETIKLLISEAIKEGFCKNGEYPTPTNVRYIYGDSVNPEKQFSTMDKLRSEKLLPTMWGIWGVGGNIVNTATRDCLSSTYKLAEISDGPVVKVPEVGSKMSVPFKTKIHDSMPHRVHRYSDKKSDIYHTYYNHTDTYDYVSLFNFNSTKQVALKSFNDFSLFASENKDFGLNRESLSDEIVKEQNLQLKIHRGIEN